MFIKIYKDRFNFQNIQKIAKTLILSGIECQHSSASFYPLFSASENVEWKLCAYKAPKF